MKTLYFDAFSGASGDMILGALVDLGADYEALGAALARLAQGRFELRRRRVASAGLSATKIDVVIVGADEEERSFREIAKIIEGGGLAAPVRDRAIEIFRRLCEAEAEVHGVAFEKVHLHEAGAADAIADVCGAAWLLDAIGAGKILASPLNVGSGTVECKHGTYPVPGPATVRLLAGVPVYAAGEPGERVTPTGAAILSTVVTAFGPLPPIVPSGIGLGAGDRSFADRPNVLRAILGESYALPISAPSVPVADGSVFVIETTIDDMNPQNYGFLIDRALAEGAYEMFLTPVLMKKGRPGIQVSAIVSPERLDAISSLLFRETTTIGIRYRRESRRELARRTVTVGTPYGPVHLKVSSEAGEVRQVQPEFEDCRALAEATKVPLKEIQRAALAAWRPEAGGAEASAVPPKDASSTAPRRTRR